MPEEVQLRSFTTDSYCWNVFLFLYINIHSWSYLESSLYLELVALAFIREQF